MIKPTIHKLFEKRVSDTPNDIAIAFENEYLTFYELNKKANVLANYLIEHYQPHPDCLIPLILKRNIDMIVTILAVLKAGAAYIPISPTWPRDRINYILNDCTANLLITQQEFLPRLDHLTLPDLQVIAMDSIEVSATPKIKNPSTNTQQHHLAYAIYTSGSTGQPKGVLIEHASVINHLSGINEYVNLRQHENFLALSAYTFDISVLEFFLPLLHGGCCVIAAENVALDPHAMSSIFTKNQIVATQATPALWQSLLSLGCQLPKKLKILCGGEALTKPIAEMLLEQVPEFWNVYGPTETTIWATIALIHRGMSLEQIPIGKPLNNIITRVINDELYIAGDCLSRGYLNNLPLTNEKFLSLSIGDQSTQRFYRTSDIVCTLPDGNLSFIGRTDHQVKINGFRVEPGEIEFHLLSHPDIAHAIIMVQENNGLKQLIACVIGTGKRTINIDSVYSQIKNTLPDYMIPSAYYQFMSFPLTTHGKIDHHQLRLDIQSKQPLANNYNPAKTKTEVCVCKIWSEVLKLNHPMGRDNNFFYSGGHSLHAAQVISRITHLYSINIRVSDLYQYPTVLEFSRYIDNLTNKSPVNKIKLTRSTGKKNIYNELSFSQERMWFVDQLDSNVNPHHLTASINIKGKLDIQRLDQAFSLMRERHDILRTVFIKRKHCLVQKIQPAKTIQSILETIRCFNTDEETLKNMAESDVKKTFRLDSEPLIRAKLYHTNEENYLLVITLHHIICDGWSLHLIAQELSHHYNVLSGMPLSPLPPLPIQYADFSRWQRQTSIGHDEVDRLFWQKQLANLPMLELPLDHARPLRPSFNGHEWIDTISYTRSKQLKSFAQKTDISLFTLFFTAFSTLCARYSGQTDFAIGTPVAGRNHIELESLIGIFINTLALRVNFSGNPDCLDLLKRHQKTLLEALNHQSLPFEQVVEVINPHRDPARTPLFQVMLVMQNTPSADWKLGHTNITPVTVNRSHSQLDLTLILEENASGITCTYLFNNQLFQLNTIKRIAAHFRYLLQQIISCPTKKAAELPMLGAEETHQLLVDWNGKKSPLPANTTLAQLFEKNALASPDSIALMNDSHTLTYFELNRKANQLAFYLSHHLAIKPGSLIPVFIDRSFDMIIAILAVLKSGCAYVPIDARYPAHRALEIINDCNANIVLSHSSLVDSLKQIAPNQSITCVDLNQAIYSDYSNGAINPAPTCKSHDTAYVIYTSGSTGKPKGVMIHHTGVINTIHAQIREFEITPQSRILQFASFSFDSAVSEIFRALLSGATLVLNHPDQLIPGDILADTIHRQHITVLTQTPAALVLLPIRACRTLKTLISAGEACPASLMQKWADKLLFINAYGPTETSICATIARGHAHHTKLSIGKPLANVKVYVLDSARHPVPVNVWGELYIGGIGVSTGYLNQPELTAQSFLHDPFDSTPNARMYKTGDRVRWLNDGNLEYGGRHDNQIKIRGFRIEPGEIEATLKQHTCIKEAVVLKKTINQDNKLIAYIVTQNNMLNISHDVRHFLRERLPNHMVPDRFIYVDNIPLTPNRKVDRIKLLELSDSDITSDYLINNNVTSVEKQLIGLFEHLLGHKSINRNDSFFDLGGHSLLLIQLAIAIESSFHKNIPINQLVANSSIAAIANLINNETPAATTSPIITLHEKNNALPIYLIHETTGISTSYITLAKELSTTHAIYGIQDPTIDKTDKFNSMKEMCKNYVCALKKQQPNGPYALIGWCMGGMIAFEMARQLSDESTDDISVILIDTPADVSENALKKTWQQEYDAIKLSFNNNDNYIHQRVIEIMYRIDLMRRYKPDYYTGNIHLICAETVSKDADIVDSSQWKKLARQMTLHQSSGDHHSMLKKPHANKLAAHIITLLNSSYRYHSP